MSDETLEKLNLFFNPPQLAEEDFLSESAPRSPHEEAELCVDVAHTADEIIIVATMAGTTPQKLELHLHNDLLTIRGERSSPVSGVEYFHRENFWGRFSRSIVLPADVRHEMVRAEYKNGVLTVWLPKTNGGKSIPIEIVEE
ncbi:MAG: Hsp20/alpha crystallin family protein [bacterium]|nr:Hsp20/alpha crystallin family protein [bacterium]